MLTNSFGLASCGRDLPPRTKVFENGIQLKNQNYLMTLDGDVGSRGRIPLIEEGKLIRAIGCSGGTDSQDEVVCGGRRGNHQIVMSAAVWASISRVSCA